MLLAACVMTACDTTADAPVARTTVDSVRTDTLGPLPVPLPPPPAWRMEEAGPLLAIAGVTPRTAIVLLPEYSDSTLHELPDRDIESLVPQAVELFSRHGKAGEAVLAEIQKRSEDGCVAWPRAEVRPPDGNLPRSWTVGLAEGVARELPLDSIESLTSADSARLAAEVTRLASIAPGDTATVLDGIPYVVRTARRFELDAQTRGLVALVGRRLASEATPLVEYVFLVAERPTGSSRATAWRIGHAERAIGAEETVETTDVLAGVLLGSDARPSLIVARDYGTSITFSLLERVSPGRWIVRWSSANATC